jgi:hypothetical protein
MTDNEILEAVRFGKRVVKMKNYHACIFDVQRENYGLTCFRKLLFYLDLLENQRIKLILNNFCLNYIRFKSETELLLFFRKLFSHSENLQNIK